MSKTFRNVIPFGDGYPGTRHDKSRTKAARVKCGWTDALERRNRRAVSIALRTGKYDKAMDIGSPESLQWDLR